MKGLGFALIGVLAVGCSGGGPMSPSVARTTIVSAGSTELRKADYKVTLTFYTNLATKGAHHSLTGLPVQITEQHGEKDNLTPDDAGKVSFAIGTDDTYFDLSTETWNHYCGITSRISVPLHPADAWIRIDHNC